MILLEHEHEPIVERIIHRLVRKHIAGTTMESALDAAKSLGGKNMGASITFLSSNVLDKPKARYITTTYSELVRRIGRSGIKASVQVPLEQIGGVIDEGTALENLEEIMAVSGKYGVFVWIDPDGLGSRIAPKALARRKGAGLAISESESGAYAKYGRALGCVKLMFKDYKPMNAGEAVKRLAEERKTYRNLVLSHPPEEMLREVLKSKDRAGISIEVALGYSRRRIGRVVKKGIAVSTLVPFGKDWIKYAMNNVPEGYMRFVAGKLLKEGGGNVA